jgi:DNA-binding NarL/FixJ family response regulator
LPSGVELVRVAGLGALYDATEEGRAPSLMVCEIPAGREHRLDQLGLVRRQPAAAKAPILVLLGRPVRRTVMRCAAAGLFDVLPADADPEVVRRRLEQLLQRASG